MDTVEQFGEAGDNAIESPRNVRYCLYDGEKVPLSSESLQFLSDKPALKRGLFYQFDDEVVERSYIKRSDLKFRFARARAFLAITIISWAYIIYYLVRKQDTNTLASGFLTFFFAAGVFLAYSKRYYHYSQALAVMSIEIVFLGQVLSGYLLAANSRIQGLYSIIDFSLQAITIIMFRLRLPYAIGHVTLAVMNNVLSQTLSIRDGHQSVEIFVFLFAIGGAITLSAVETEQLQRNEFLELLVAEKMCAEAASRYIRLLTVARGTSELDRSAMTQLLTDKVRMPQLSVISIEQPPLQLPTVPVVGNSVGESDEDRTTQISFYRHLDNNASLIDFDAFNTFKCRGPNSLIFLSEYVFNELRFYETFRLDRKAAHAFFRSVMHAHVPNPFHNIINTLDGM